MTPYDEGLAARQSDAWEPECPYTPGTAEYAEFARGYCSLPFKRFPESPE